MKGQVNNNILEYMNSMGSKQFTYVQVSNIAAAIRLEHHDRKLSGLKIKTKTEAGKRELNKRVAQIVNKRLGTDAITPDDVRLYKKCWAEEYTNRTGKCAWGFKELRQRLGYDPETGKELKENI